MQIEVKHSLTQRFSEEIIPDPYNFRTMPYQLGKYHITNYRQHISPEPLGTTIKKDIINNTVAFSWFNKPTHQIRAEISFEAELTPYDPLDIHVYPPEFLTLRFHYSRLRWPLLIPYLETSNLSTELKKLGKQAAERTHNETFPFILELAQKISSNISIDGNSFAPVANPSDVYNLRSGSAADIAWLMIQLLRVNGIAARFVRGYQYDSISPMTDMHCWLQVYVPGPGWFGVDPCKGKPADFTYIPVSASSVPEGTLPMAPVDLDKATDLESRVSIKRL